MLKNSLKILSVLFLSVLFTDAAFAKSKKLKSEKDKVSYSIGLDIGTNLKKQPYKININKLIQGLRDSYKGKKTLLKIEEARKFIMKFQKEIRKKKELEMQERSKDAVKEGKKFLEENKKRKEVKTTSTGLQYEVLKEGSGKKPSKTDTVKTHYKGMLINGNVFDSSYKRNEPAKFRVDQVIPGWIEALQLMTVGSKWKLFIPSNLAYAERGAPPVIGPNETLVFEIELLGIE